ncbi:hypothetical protein DKX38_009549 [Salix brachista]|uniref:Uncharacterized protein n=1 Tax=Salix brachista TaxID=2182728 RepID=A0A5N5MB04_9ROSI|nr:hypothetical protein DKX38_009549 [Salix brachista]
MVVIEGAASLESLLRDMGNKNGQPPASKASIEAMPSVEIGEDNKDETWLKIHGNCPVCKYEMPVNEEELGKKRDGGDEGREWRRTEREIWVSFAFNGIRRNRDSNENPSSDSTDFSTSSPSATDHETES